MSWSISILQYLNESIHFYHKKCSVYSLYSTQCVDSCNSIRGFPMKCLLRNLLRCLPLVSALLSRQMKSVLNRQICFHLGKMHFSISIICFDRFFNGKFYRYTRSSDDKLERSHRLTRFPCWKRQNTCCLTDLVQ